MLQTIVKNECAHVSKKIIKLCVVCMSPSSVLLGDVMMDSGWKPLFWLTFEQVS